MKLISENIHIISKDIKEAILNRNEEYIREILIKQIVTKPDWIDLNIGPAKKNFSGSMSWIMSILNELTDIPVSFDTSNKEEIISGLKLAKNSSSSIINSTSADPEKLKAVTLIAKEYDSNLIALTLNNEIGIPKSADERLELAFEIIERTTELEIDNSKLFFDPLILPINVDQSQSLEALNTIRMFKESFDPPVNTTIGLSNVSNGCPKEIKKLINQTFFILAAGCGLTSAIVDSFDSELLKINNLLENKNPQNSYEKLILSLYEMMQNFTDLEEITYDSSNKKEVNLIKTAEIILNKKIYSNSYLEI